MSRSILGKEYDRGFTDGHRLAGGYSADILDAERYEGRLEGIEEGRAAARAWFWFGVLIAVVVVELLHKYPLT